MRLEVCLGAFGRLVDGKPGTLISPDCEAFRKACNGGYHYRILRSGNGLSYSEEPAKNGSSHVADAFQYLLLGGGEASVVMNKAKRAARKPFGPAGGDYDIFDHAYGRDGPDTRGRRRQEYLKRIGFYEADFR